MELELGTIQLRFAELVWENEPIPSGELVKLCETRFMWKKSTTYTVIKTLCEKGLIQNNNVGMSSAAGLYQSVVGFILVITANAIVRKIDSESSLF